jgi:2-keto-4-pentenoate hydratase/2-oxohepta-3-ene-1,7-dioic acid hydratase in catechol pathway
VAFATSGDAKRRITAGTPGGVGYVKHRAQLVPGSTVTVSIDGVGSLKTVIDSK